MSEFLAMVTVILVCLAVGGLLLVGRLGRGITVRPEMLHRGWATLRGRGVPPTAQGDDGPTPSWEDSPQLHAAAPAGWSRAADPRPPDTALVAPARPTPTVTASHRLVIEAPRGGAERETRLPDRVVASSGWHGSFFHGWCGVVDGVRPAARLVVRGAALRGASHASMGTEGQDSIGAAWDDRRGALYLAVADGVGSLARSGRVAVEAVNAALHLCITRPHDSSFATSGAQLFDTIAAGMTKSLAADMDDFDGACTLVVAEVVPRPEGASVTVLGVGDSEAWVLFDRRWTVIHHERREADNGTRSLPSHVRPDQHAYDLPPGSVLVLGSDGFAGALDSSTSPLAARLGDLWCTRPSWLDFVNHIGFVDEYWSDDRAAVAVWIGEGSIDG